MKRTPVRSSGDIIMPSAWSAKLSLERDAELLRKALIPTDDGKRSTRKVYTDVYRYTYGWEPTKKSMKSDFAQHRFKLFEEFLKEHPVNRLLWIRAQMSHYPQLRTANKAFQPNLLLGAGAEDRYNRFITSAVKKHSVNVLARPEASVVEVLFARLHGDSFRIGREYLAMGDKRYEAFGMTMEPDEVWNAVYARDHGEGHAVWAVLLKLYSKAVIEQVATAATACAQRDALATFQHDLPAYVHEDPTWNGLRMFVQTILPEKRKRYEDTRGTFSDVNKHGALWGFEEKH